MADEFAIRVRIWPDAALPRPQPHGPDVEGITRVPICATCIHDQEANAKRLAEQMITELFRRFRVQRGMEN